MKKIILTIALALCLSATFAKNSTKEKAKQVQTIGFIYVLYEDGCYKCCAVEYHPEMGLYSFTPIGNDPSYLSDYPGMQRQYCPYSAIDMANIC